MSRLDELIKELCPNGVEYKELGEVCIIVTSPLKLKKADYKIEGKIPIIDQGEEYVAGYTDLKKYLPKDEYILFGDHSEIIKYVNFEFIQGADGLKILRTKNQLNTKYVYYCFNNFYKKENGYKRHWSNAKITLIPVPPLEVQDEIVRILDDYTKSVEELKEKLNEELISRKKQYSWYRDYLLKFENKVKIVKLKNIATEMYRGNGIKREEVRETGTPCVRYGEIYTEYGISFEKTKLYTDENLITNKKYIEYGDILFAITGESIEEIGKSTAYIGKEKCLVGGDILVMKHKQDPVYLSYVLSTENAQKQKSKGKIKSKVVHTNATDIGEIEIPLPPLEVQKRIVEVLDNFEKTCKKLNIELSSEIEIKQKEYEFVRNYLLTFEEKSRQAILACELA
jgi:type I restriction system specificity protein